MNFKNIWAKFQNLGFMLLIVNAILVLPSNIKSFKEVMFQSNHSPVSTHQIWSEYGSNANVRQCPKQSCDIVATLVHGTEVRAIERVDGQTIGGSNKWHRVEHKGAAGFVFGKLLREIDRLT